MTVEDMKIAGRGNKEKGSGMKGKKTKGERKEETT